MCSLRYHRIVAIGAALALGWVLPGPAPAAESVEPKASNREEPKASNREEQNTAPVSLAELVRQALERNPELAAARRRATAARERPRQERALEDPTFSVTYWGIPEDLALGGTDQVWYGIAQSVPLGGKLRLRGERADREARQAEEEARGIALDLAARMKRAYYDLYLAEAAGRIQRENVALLRDFARSAEARYATGSGSQQDVLKAQVELAQLINEQATREQERRIATDTINLLRGYPPETPIGPAEEPAEPHFPYSMKELELILSERRPGLRSAGYEVERRQNTLALARRRLVPDLMVELQRWEVRTGNDQWMAMLKFNLPWVWWGRQRAALREEREGLEGAKEAYLAEAARTHLEVRHHQLMLQTLERTARLYRTTILPQAELALASSEAGYRAGKLDFLALIDNQRRLQEFKLEYVRTRAEFYQVLAELEQAVGSELSPGAANTVEPKASNKDEPKASNKDESKASNKDEPKASND